MVLFTTVLTVRASALLARILIRAPQSLPIPVSPALKVTIPALRTTPFLGWMETPGGWALQRLALDRPVLTPTAFTSRIEKKKRLRCRYIF